MKIGTLREKSLHADLKAFYTQPGDIQECSVDGYVIDIMRPQPGQAAQYIEIQTRSFGNMKPKLMALLDKANVLVIYPVAVECFIVKVDQDGVVLSRRKSPKHGTLYDVFSELVSIPGFIAHPHFALEIAFIHQEDVWIDDGQGSWRRKRWSIYDRRLLKVIECKRLSGAEDFRQLLPENLPRPFTCRDLAAALKQQLYVAQKMAYCLREAGLLEVAGKRGNARLYSICEE